MIHTTRFVLDASGTAAAGTVAAGVAPSRFVGAYYQFEDPVMSATIKVRNLGRDVFTKTGAINSDGFQPATKEANSELPVCNGYIVVDVTQITNGSPGDELFLTLYFDRGGSG